MSPDIVIVLLPPKKKTLSQSERVEITGPSSQPLWTRRACYHRSALASSRRCMESQRPKSVRETQVLFTKNPGNCGKQPGDKWQNKIATTIPEFLVDFWGRCE